MLPSPHQQWAHSTCSVLALESALSQEKPCITAIEADIIMGYRQGVPIMAHPPQVDSDLDLATFLQRTIPGPAHLKLDFKDSTSLIPSLDLISQRIQTIHPMMDRTTQHTIFLNADLLAGPGYRNEEPKINVDFFISSCLQHDICKSKHVAFSIGWRTDCRAMSGYTHTDVEQLKYYIFKYDLLTQSQGIVIPVNARILRKNVEPMVMFLQDLAYTSDKVQLLVWTGLGEPSISRNVFQYLKQYFDSRNLTDRVGYDCQVTRNAWVGLFIDFLVTVIGVLWTAKRACFRAIQKKKVD